MKQPNKDRILQFNQETNKFNTVYKKFRRQILYFSKGLVGDIFTAEEITNDVFIKSWPIIDQYLPNENVKAFLYAVARNACRDHFRSQQRLNENKIKYEQYLLEAAASVTDERIIEIKDQIELLPKRMKEVMEFSLLGYDDAEISKILGIKLRTVQHYRWSALEILRNHFCKEIPGETICLFLNIQPAIPAVYSPTSDPGYASA